MPRKRKPDAERRRWTKVTPELKHQMYADFYHQKLTIRDIAIKYTIHRETAAKAIRSIEPPEVMNPSVVRDRKNLMPTDRLELVKRDAGEAVEMTLALIRHRVAIEIVEIENKSSEVENKTQEGKRRLDMKDLVSFFKEAAPYVLPKVDSSGKVEREEKDSNESIFDIFKKEQKNNKKPSA